MCSQTNVFIFEFGLLLPLMLPLEFVHFCFLEYTWSCERLNDPLTEVDNLKKRLSYNIFNVIIIINMIMVCSL